MKAKCLTRLGTIALALVTVFSLEVSGEEVASIRTLPIPKEEHGYRNFSSTVISSPDELKAFLKTSLGTQGMEWSNRKDFEEGIIQAQLNFDKEALVVVRHTEGSSSTGINFRCPLVKGKRLLCQIERNEPEIGTPSMAYYCFALAVSKRRIAEIELKVPGKQAILLTLKSKTKPNKPDETDSK